MAGVNLERDWKARLVCEVVYYARHNMKCCTGRLIMRMLVFNSSGSPRELATRTLSLILERLHQARLAHQGTAVIIEQQLFPKVILEVQYF